MDDYSVLGGSSDFFSWKNSNFYGHHSTVWI